MRKAVTLSLLLTLLLMKASTSLGNDNASDDNTSPNVTLQVYNLPEIVDSEATNLVSFDSNSTQVIPSMNKTMVCENSTLTYRTIDGACNNLDHPNWGRAFQPPQRYLAPDYGSPEGFPRNMSATGKPLKSARFISRNVAIQVSHMNELTTIVMAWGQFIDHDLTAFPVIQQNGISIRCCNEDLDPSLRIENGGPCNPIMIDDEDDFFQGQNCMELVRSVPAKDENGELLSPREQTNALTSYLDASGVYGSTKEINEKLRAPDGKLVAGPNNMLPPSETTNCKLDNETDYCLFAGDHRVNVFVSLGIFHTLFLRFHNKLVDGLREINHHWDAEKLYQEARKIISALIQHFTYHEYLSRLLNAETLESYRLQVGDYTYDPTVRGDMANVFSSAALRLGHSQIPPFVMAGQDLFKTEDTLMRPHLVLTRFDEIAEGLAAGHSEIVDRFFVDAITDRLFENNPSERDGLDLIALNIQRGRDHGLPSYNAFRSFCKLSPVTSLNSSVFASGNLSHVYDHPDDIDVFIGGVMEHHLPNSSVGPLFACILGKQFFDIKFGDRFFYETNSDTEGFTDEQLQEIKNQTLASFMCANTGIKSLQKNVMLRADDETNPHVLCEDTPRLNLSKWITDL